MGETVLSQIEDPSRPGFFYVLTSLLKVVSINVSTGEGDLKFTLSKEIYPIEASFHLAICPRGRYLSVTRIHDPGQSAKGTNMGAIFDLRSGAEVLTLDAGDYHMEQALFPVCFVINEGKTLVVHATDWNRIDITDLAAQECLTKRDLEKSPGNEDDSDYLFREWAGQLIPSPSNTRLASNGWVWHPFGCIYSFDLKRWIDGNLWETDASEHMRSYAGWDGWWDSKFLWIDDRRLCIWGAALEEEHDKYSATIFDADTEEELITIHGPTNDILFFDEFLFSGIHEKGGDKHGLSIYDINDGSILFRNEDIRVDLYVYATKEIVSFHENGILLIYTLNAHLDG